jgi:hypothetical protein
MWQLRAHAAEVQGLKEKIKELQAEVMMIVTPLMMIYIYNEPFATFARLQQRQQQRVLEIKLVIAVNNVNHLRWYCLKRQRQQPKPASIPLYVLPYAYPSSPLVAFNAVIHRYFHHNHHHYNHHHHHHHHHNHNHHHHHHPHRHHQALGQAVHDSEMVTLRARVQALGDVVRASCSASPAGQSVSPMKGGIMATKFSPRPAIASVSSSLSSSAAAAAATAAVAAAVASSASVSPTRSSSNQLALQPAAQAQPSSLSSSATKHLLPPVQHGSIESPVEASASSAGRAAVAAALALAQQSKITGAEQP